MIVRPQKCRLPFDVPSTQPTVALFPAYLQFTTLELFGFSSLIVSPLFFPPSLPSSFFLLFGPGFSLSLANTEWQLKSQPSSRNPQKPLVHCAYVEDSGRTTHTAARHTNIVIMVLTSDVLVFFFFLSPSDTSIRLDSQVR